MATAASTPIHLAALALGYAWRSICTGLKWRGMPSADAFWPVPPSVGGGPRGLLILCSGSYVVLPVFAFGVKGCQGRLRLGC
eukprot:14751208-Heterocapsa_arctica.AAC.1